MSSNLVMNAIRSETDLLEQKIGKLSEELPRELPQVKEDLVWRISVARHELDDIRTLLQIPSSSSDENFQSFVKILSSRIKLLVNTLAAIDQEIRSIKTHRVN